MELVGKFNADIESYINTNIPSQIYYYWPLTCNALHNIGYLLLNKIKYCYFIHLQKKEENNAYLILQIFFFKNRIETPCGNFHNYM